ncbi:sensor histidine kinase [Compostimonas suwonensis]|uniref:sensor histidine kinase n=1 Tax=Compostimonas suwonensis TaxID=1048394 RepID=UPI001FE8CF5E|nr:HAMP domain-containing sensor histidine kinase [Compostimonas suwonensis]
MTLLAVVSAVIGVVSVVYIENYLTTELDEQLTNTVDRAGRAIIQPGSPVLAPSPRGESPPWAELILNAPAQPEGSLAVVEARGEILSAGYLDRAGEIQSLGSDQQAQIAGMPHDNRPHTVELGGDLGSYRVFTLDGPGGEALVIGLSLGPLQDTVAKLIAIIAVVTVVGMALVALLAAGLVRLALRPLERVVTTATRVSELPLDRGDVSLAPRVPEGDTDPGTEVGRVGVAFNRMLDHVGAALRARATSEAKVRQFVADASHELRTPLASIRGYSELTRRVQHDLPIDVTHSLGRIEAESLRMTTLVEDLLLLARLDEGRELERRPVDLSRLAVDALSDAHVAGPDHEWEMELPDEPVETLGDAPRLHQVVANLLTNARVHTPPGTTVVLALETHDGEAVLSVTDDGPGIDAGVRDVIFERFARGDNSRSRATGSTGLGLSIVHAVVAAQNGTVTLESRPGRTRFEVHLPFVEPAEGARARSDEPMMDAEDDEGELVAEGRAVAAVEASAVEADGPGLAVEDEPGDGGRQRPRSEMMEP